MRINNGSISAILKFHVLSEWRNTVLFVLAYGRFVNKYIRLQKYDISFLTRINIA